MMDGVTQVLVSVIIPIYNVEKYLDRCLESIVNQTYKNLEILLIDDGSSDMCPQMCDEWASKDPRIRVFHKRNEGLGKARNTGIEKATGEYICFFDSDDYVSDDTIQLSCTAMRYERADVVLFGMNRVNKEGEVVSCLIPNLSQTVYCGSNVQDILLPAVLSTDVETGMPTGIPTSACNMLIARDLIEKTGWRFVSEREIISEDIYSLLLLYKDVQKAVVLKEALYFYCINETSLTQSYRTDRYEKSKMFYEQCIKLCRMQGYGVNVIKACMGPFMGNTLLTIKQLIENKGNYIDARKMLRKIIDDQVLQQVLREKREHRISVKFLLWAMKHRIYVLCYILVKMKNESNRRKKL